MTQQEIEAFLETVQQGSISAAAETFFITQPALSRRISILEEELGYILFHRRKGSRNVELTEEGKAFLPIARKTLQLWKEAAAVPALIDKAMLNITAVPSITSYVLSGVLRRYLKENPEEADKLEAQIRENAFKLMSPQAKAAAVASGRAVDVAADDFED